jgi:hypothetical protein
MGWPEWRISEVITARPHARVNQLGYLQGRPIGCCGAGRLHRSRPGRRRRPHRTFTGLADTTEPTSDLLAMRMRSPPEWTICLGGTGLVRATSPVTALTTAVTSGLASSATISTPALPPPPRGALAGGANSRPSPDFPYDSRLLGLPPQCCYLDEPTSEVTNDVCIRWNAPLVWIAIYLNTVND